MYTIGTHSLQMRLHIPGDGFYEGTRFDRSGVWDSLRFQGMELCDRWFSSYHPAMHDAVCGPAEEYSPVFLPGGKILKMGVGLLKADDAPYDRFKLYPILDGGEWTAACDGANRVVYRHRLEGYYDYSKEIVLTGESSFEIRHSLRGPFEGEVYNHNFFTMGKLEVGPSREIDFPFSPEGTWRAVYDSVAFTPSGVRFLRALREGESVYCGDIHEAGREGMPYALSLKEGEVTVSIGGSLPVSRTVLWSNHRIACLEPYNRLSVGPGETFSWTVSYHIQKR